MGLGLLVVLATVSATCSLDSQQHKQHKHAPGSLNLLHFVAEGPAGADLSVGTEPGKANVVSGFDVVSTWGSGDDLASSVPSTKTSSSFYLKAKGGSLQMTRATVEPATLPHLRSYLEGQLSTQLRQNGQVNLRKDEEKLLRVAYDCLSVSPGGPTPLTLTLEFEGLSPVAIPLQKTCGGQKNTALTVSTGTASDGEKVVIMGLPKWDELKVVGVRQITSVFTVFVDPLSEQGAQVIGLPKATGIGACAAQADPKSLKKFDGKKSKNLAAGDSVDMAVQYRCFRHGNCIVSAEVPFSPDMAPYQPLRWSWTKVCGGEALGIDVEALGVGKSPRRLLASDGAANTSSSTATWIVEKDVIDHKVRLFNDEKRSLEPEIKVNSLTVRCLDTKRCTSRLKDAVPKLLRSDSPFDVNVEYDCHQSGSSMVQLVLATEGHENVVATWAKDCSAFSDSLLGVCLVFILTFTCFSCACVGFVKLFFENPLDSKKRGAPLLEGEFEEDENLTPEDLSALDNYEAFYGLQKGAASVEQVKDSTLGIAGWAIKAPDP